MVQLIMRLKNLSKTIQIQWGSEIQFFKIMKLFEVWTFWRSDFKWSSFSYGYSYSPNHLKNGQFNICPEDRWFLTKWQLFVWISNGWAFGFQIPFQIRTICNPTSFWPFQIQTSPDFRSPLYWTLSTHTTMVRNTSCLLKTGPKLHK